MENGILIYAKDGTPGQVLPLVSVLQPAMERILGRSLGGARLQLLVYGVPDDALLSGTPALLNLRPDYGYARVSVEEQGIVTYRHPHRVQEVLGQQLQHMLAKAVPEGTIWGYHLVLNGMPRPPMALASL